MRVPSLAVVLSFLCFSQTDTELRALGRDGYLFAYPLVLMDRTRDAAFGARGSVGLAETGGFTHAQAFPNDKFRQVVRPNADTLYSTAWIDLSSEPMLMRVPDTGGRYYLMQILDGWTETVSVPGKRTTGTSEGWFALVGPGWKGKLPERAQRVDCATNMVWVLGRTQTNNSTDYANVHKIQAGYKLMPLSRYPDGPSRTMPLPAMSRPAVEVRVPPPVTVEKMSTEEFFTAFARLLEANPPHVGDAAMISRLASIGVRAGERFKGVAGAAFEEGVQVAKQILSTAESRRGAGANVGPNGWTKVSSAVGHYGTNYLARAVVARIGLGANPPEDAVYLSCYLDSTGAALEGSNEYKIHFDKSQLPPVGAFWSVTTYDSQGYFAANPIGRYAIGDRDPLVYNADGSLDLYVQAGAPAKEHEANWLPAPKDGFSLMFRLYWPKEEILSGAWTPPAVVKH